MQRASPASTRCSGDHASSSGIGEPPSSLRGSPVAVDRDGVRERLGARGHGGNLHSPHVARDPRRHRVHGPPRARRGPDGQGLRCGSSGRRADALEELARAGEEVRVADARDGEALCVPRSRGAVSWRRSPGRFSQLGSRAGAGRRRSGAHYLDTSGEQAVGRARPGWFDSGETARAARVRLRLRPRRPGRAPRSGEGRRPAGRARRRVFGRRASARAAARGARSATSWARSRSPGRTDGSSRPRFGATTRTMRFPFGERTVVEWGGTEPLTVPRHTDVRNVRSYIRAPAIAAKAGGLGRLAAPFVRAASRLGPSGPSEASRGKSRFTVVAEARGRGGEGRAVVEGTDVYGLTALPDRPRRSRRFWPARRAAQVCSLRQRPSTPARSPAGSSRYLRIVE